jgi:hypothetical protein
MNTFAGEGLRCIYSPIFKIIEVLFGKSLVVKYLEVLILRYSFFWHVPLNAITFRHETPR